MRSIAVKIFSLLIISILFCCSNDTLYEMEPQQSVKELPRELTGSEKLLISSDNSFGIKLFKEIVNAEGDRNIFISPLSAYFALGMTFNGAGGETLKEMRNTLEYGSMPSGEINMSYKSLIELLTGLDPEVEFSIANSIWSKLGYPVEQDFINLNRTYFDAEVEALDFSDPAAKDEINNWVSGKTNEKIKEIIEEPIDPLTMMFLINAVFFKGAWTTKFNPDNTREMAFYKSDGSSVQREMMGVKDKFEYFENEDFQAVNLPYNNGLYCMTILLPAAVKSLDGLISDLNKARWDTWMNGFRTKEVSVYIPKFKLDYKIKMNDVLSNMGMGSAFSVSKADFSRINPANNLFISKVLQKTYLDINEEGTEASAVTMVEMTLKGPSGGSELIFKADRPYMLVIREVVSGAILFMGKIVEPPV